MPRIGNGLPTGNIHAAVLCEELCNDRMVRLDYSGGSRLDQRRHTGAVTENDVQLTMVNMQHNPMHDMQMAVANIQCQKLNPWRYFQVITCVFLFVARFKLD
jgi:hypothetical protein